LSLQSKLDIRSWLRKDFLNDQMTGTKYPAVITWKYVDSHGGGREIELSWKAAM
jgi:hypothetical protein